MIPTLRQQTICASIHTAIAKAVASVMVAAALLWVMPANAATAAPQQGVHNQHLRLFQKEPLTFDPAAMINEGDYYQCYKAGLSRPIKCLDMMVPENWDQPSAEKINLHMAIIPAKGGFSEDDPFIVFAGGPGQAATDYGSLVRASFDRINERRDIILIDQRGSGMSNPLSCETDDESFSGANKEMMVQAIQNCLASYDVDVRHFTSFDAIKDFEYVRQKLAISQWNIWGGSYGTRIGLLYMKHHPEVIRTAILDGVAAPNSRLFVTAPGDSQASFDKLVTDCLKDEGCRNSFPNVERQLFDLIDQLNENPFDFTWQEPLSGKEESFLLNGEVVANIVRTSLYAPQRWAMVPYIVDQAERLQNYKPLVSLALDGEVWAGSSMYIGLTLSVLCAEEVPRNVAADAAREGEGSFHKDYYYQFWLGACSQWPIKSVLAGYEDPIESDIPTLILSGALDPVTPEGRGNDAAKHLKNVWHLTSNAAGHNVSHVACAPKIMADFIKDMSLPKDDYDCLDQPIRPYFMTSPTGARH